MRSPLISFVFLVSLLSTCHSAPPTASEPSRIAGTVRYLQDAQTLRSTLQIEAPAEAPRPQLLGQEFEPLPVAGENYFRSTQQLHYPSILPFHFPCGTQLCPQDYKLSPVFVDSFPAQFSRSEKLRVRISDQPLEAGETLVFFFEPKDTNTPRRIRMLGPTAKGTIVLPPDSFDDIPVGNYAVYLVRQRLDRDSTAQLTSSLQLEYITRTQPVAVTE